MTNLTNTFTRLARMTIAFLIGFFLTWATVAPLAQPGSTPPSAEPTTPQPLPQIAGGLRANLRNWPGIGVLRTPAGANSHDVYCAATAITPDWILTAGHCALSPHRAIEFVAGVPDLAEAGPETIHTVVETIRHPDYGDPLTDGADIALMRLGRPHEGPFARVATAADEEPAAGAAVIVAGYGDAAFGASPLVITQGPAGQSAQVGSRALREAELALVEPEACRAAYAAFGQDYAIGAGQLCAAPKSETPLGSCQRDSGAGLVSFGENGSVIIGLVSWAYECGRPDFPTVYTRVSSHAAWIARVIRYADDPS